MSQQVMTHFWRLGGFPEDQELSRQLLRAGLKPREVDPSAPDEAKATAILRAFEPAGVNRTLGLLEAGETGLSVGVDLITLKDSSLQGSLLRIGIEEHELPDFGRKACPPQIRALEAILSRLFDVTESDYGYTAAEASIGILIHPKVHQSNSMTAARFEWQALLKHRILELHPINYFSSQFIVRFPGLKKKLPQLRVSRIEEHGWRIALADCLTRDAFIAADTLALECGIDACWKTTADLEIHVPGCTLAEPST